MLRTFIQELQIPSVLFSASNHNCQRAMLKKKKRRQKRRCSGKEGFVRVNTKTKVKNIYLLWGA